MAIESACIPFPSEIIMPLAGWFLIEEKGHGWEYLLLAGFYGALGNLLGSLVAYYAGMWGGRPFLLKYGRWVLITPKEIDLADRWFAKYGEITVFASRMLPVVRTFISLPAGIARMNIWRFSVSELHRCLPVVFGPCLGRVPPGGELGGHLELHATREHSDRGRCASARGVLRLPADQGDPGRRLRTRRERARGRPSLTVRQPR